MAVFVNSTWHAEGRQWRIGPGWRRFPERMCERAVEIDAPSWRLSGCVAMAGPGLSDGKTVRASHGRDVPENSLVAFTALRRDRAWNATCA